MRRKWTDPKTFDITYTCPKCGYKIVPNELVRTDGEHIRCTACGKESLHVRLR
jgi:predicted RNA-binding Zn-ribbon protein involved in translation (DUF1610 family)